MAEKKLGIDPGHGMGNTHYGKFDTGAVNGGLIEAKIAEKWAETIRFIFMQRGIGCFVTHTGQTNMPLTKRAPSAEAAGCTHFLAIHCNAGGGAGVEAFYRDNGDQEFANAVCNAAVEATGLKNRGVKPEYNSQYKHLAVLSFKGRAALLEIGYLDNKQDAKALVNRDVRIAFANKLADMFM